MDELINVCCISTVTMSKHAKKTYIPSVQEFIYYNLFKDRAIEYLIYSPTGEKHKHKKLIEISSTPSSWNTRKHLNSWELGSYL